MSNDAQPTTRWWTTCSDRALWLAIGGALFVLMAWPLLLVALPPLQDLPNHVASAYIAERLDQYPDYVFNGYWKSNSLLQIWLHGFADHLYLGARLFAAVTVAVNAFALPWCVLQLAGRRAMISASLLVWPLVHGFTYSMGFMNFSIALPLALVLLVLLDRQRVAATLPRTIGIVALSIAVWLAHSFPLFVVGVLCVIAVLAPPQPLAWRARVRLACALLLPLVPIGALVLGTAVHHLVKAEGAPTAASKGFEFLTVWEYPLHFWLDAAGALTRWGSMAVIPAIVLPIVAWRRRRAPPPAMLGNAATMALLIGYIALPLMISNWWYLNTRLVPFLWFAFALRVPPAWSRRMAAVLVASALAFSVVLGVDYVRLDREYAAFTAGIDAVPERATLLPLLFEHRKASDFTASLTHAWAFYTIAKQTSAPGIFAIERSYPITYRTFPPAALIPPALDRFAELYATPERQRAVGGCSVGRSADDCAAMWRLTWAQFWTLAEPRFSHVLTWAMPAETQAVMSPRYRVRFELGELRIYERTATPAARR